MPKGICYKCTSDREVSLIKGLCQRHYWASRKEVHRLKLYKKPVKKSPTGERALFVEIWQQRVHLCQVCSKTIAHPKIHNFAHLLSKKSYPRFRLYKENILILCFDYGQGCHEKLDCRSMDELIKDDRWTAVFEKIAHLKTLYYATSHTLQGPPPPH